MNEPLAYRRVPADGWTDQHLALRDQLEAFGIDPSDATPEWIETDMWVEDVKGRPHGITTIREAAIHNCPPSDGITRMHNNEEDDR